MEDKKLPEAVPYIAFESEMARSERHIKRLTICVIICIILLFASNAIWLYQWNQYDTVSYDQDGEGMNNICTGVQGDISNVTTSQDKEAEEQKESKGNQDKKE